MNISTKDFDELAKIRLLENKIDSIDAKYATTISDEMFLKQPFFLTILIGYRFDTTSQELEEIMKLYFLIWEYFKTDKNVQVNQVSESYFEKVQHKHIEMLRYAEGEPGEFEKMQLFTTDLNNLKSKALFAAIVYRYQNRQILQKMDQNKRGIILVGIKSFIECFDALGNV
jgi:hypothetical protein